MNLYKGQTQELLVALFTAVQFCVLAEVTGGILETLEKCHFLCKKTELTVKFRTFARFTCLL